MLTKAVTQMRRQRHRLSILYMSRNIVWRSNKCYYTSDLTNRESDTNLIMRRAGLSDLGEELTKSWRVGEVKKGNNDERVVGN